MSNVAPHKLSSVFATDRPIVQAPMAGIQGSRLAIAVSNAGGLGSLPCAMLSEEKIEAELTLIKSQTDKPFNLNFFCHTSPQADPTAEEAWRQLLSPYYDEFGLEVKDIKDGPARNPFTSATADLIEKFAPPVISFHFGLPDAKLVDRLKSWGSKILASATTVDERLTDRHHSPATHSGRSGRGHRLRGGHFGGYVARRLRRANWHCFFTVPRGGYQLRSPPRTAQST